MCPQEHRDPEPEWVVLYKVDSPAYQKRAFWYIGYSFFKEHFVGDPPKKQDQEKMFYPGYGFQRPIAFPSVSWIIAVNPTPLISIFGTAIFPPSFSTFASVLSISSTTT
jgi:hypothetical protein